MLKHQNKFAFLTSMLLVLVFLQTSPTCLAQNESGSKSEQKNDSEISEKRKRDLLVLGESLKGGESLSIVVFFLHNTPERSADLADLREAWQLVSPNPKASDLKHWCLTASLNGKPDELAIAVERHLKSTPDSVDANCLRFILMADNFKKYNINWTASKPEALNSLIKSLANKDAAMHEYMLVETLGHLFTLSIESRNSPGKNWLEDKGKVEAVKAIIDSPNIGPSDLIQEYCKAFPSGHAHSTETEQLTQTAIDLSEAVLKRCLVSESEVEWETYRQSIETFDIYVEDLIATGQTDRGFKLLDLIESAPETNEELAQEQESLVFRNRIVLAKHANPTLATKTAIERIDKCLERFKKDKNQFVPLMNAFEISFLAVDIKGFALVFSKFKELGYLNITNVETFGPLFRHHEDDYSHDRGNKTAYSQAIAACFSRFVEGNIQPQFFNTLKQISELENWTVQLDESGPQPFVDDDQGSEQLLNDAKFNHALALFAKHAQTRTLLNEMHLETENWLNRSPQDLKGKVVVLLLRNSSSKVPVRLRQELESLSDRENVFFSAIERGARESWRPQGENAEKKAPNSLPKFPVIKIYNNTLSCQLLDFMNEIETDRSETYRVLIFDKTGRLSRLMHPGFDHFENIETTIEKLLRN